MNTDEEVIDINSNPERYSGVYKDLAELLGDAATLKIWKSFSGLNITFPQKLYSIEFRKEFIMENMRNRQGYRLGQNLPRSRKKQDDRMRKENRYKRRMI